MVGREIHEVNGHFNDSWTAKTSMLECQRVGEAHRIPLDLEEKTRGSSMNVHQINPFREGYNAFEADDQHPLARWDRGPNLLKST